MGEINWMKNIELKRQVELMDEHQSGCQGTQQT
jgi:hypothetical protein